MSRGRTVALLLVALVAPCGALAAFGAYRLIDDRSRAAVESETRASAALDAGAAALDAVVAALPTLARAPGRDIVRVVLAADGSIVELENNAPAVSVARSTSETRPAWASAPASRPVPVATPIERDALAVAEAEADRLERAGKVEEALARLTAFVDASATDAAAAALTAQAAIAHRAGMDAPARVAWQRIIDQFPDAFDRRGLRRAIAARREWAATLTAADGATAARLADEALTLLRHDYRSTDDTATALALYELPAHASRRSPPAGTADAADVPRNAERLVRAAVTRGLAAHIARGPTAGPFFADVPPVSPAEWEPERVLATGAVDAAGRWQGGAATLATVAATAMRRPEMTAFAGLGYGIEVARAAVAAVPGDATVLRTRPLGGVYAGHALVARDAGLSAQRDAAQRSLWMMLAVVTAGLALAVAGAVVTGRAVQREISASRGRESFVAAVTHELKTPLASIKLLAELLGRGGVSPADTNDFSRRIVGESDRLARLVNSVLDLARIEHAADGGADAGPRAAVAAVDIFHDVTETMGPAIAAQGFSLEVAAASAPGRAAGGAPLCALCDRAAIARALINLVDNAVKYSDAPHAITLRAESVGGAVELAVLDRGRGVPAGDRQRIFAPFTRLGDELTRDRPGVGLGLALVARIAAVHGGSVRHEAREGGGSAFIIALPAARESSSGGLR